MASTPFQELSHRIHRLQAGMAAQSLDGALIVQRADLFYFSGTGQDAHLFVPVEGEPLLVVRKSLERVQQDSPLRAVPSARPSELKSAVDAAGSRPILALGMELDVLPVNSFRFYQELFPGIAIEDVSPLIKEVRMVKSAYELDLIRQAALLNDEMFAYAAATLREGMSEMEFSGLVESWYRKRGHQGLVRVRSFNQEVIYGHIMSGPNLAVPSATVGPTGGPGPHPSLPHGAGSRIIGRHEPVQVDYVAVVGGYMVDQARTFYLGEPPKKFLDIHAVALAIQDAVAAQGLPGIPCEALYETALRMTADAGLTDGFMGWPQPVPFLGHGVGIELDEFPLIGRKSPHVLQEGMVIALEPKFVLPGEGLAGIENTFVVTAEGLEKLTRFDDEIRVLD